MSAVLRGTNDFSADRLTLVLVPGGDDVDNEWEDDEGDMIVEEGGGEETGTF